jgi:hypothetical protein
MPESVRREECAEAASGVQVCVRLACVPLQSRARTAIACASSALMGSTGTGWIPAGAASVAALRARAAGAFAPGVRAWPAPARAASTFAPGAGRRIRSPAFTRKRTCHTEASV